MTPGRALPVTFPRHHSHTQPNGRSRCMQIRPESRSEGEMGAYTSDRSLTEGLRTAAAAADNLSTGPRRREPLAQPECQLRRLLADSVRHVRTACKLPTSETKSPPSRRPGKKPRSSSLLTVHSQALGFRRLFVRSTQERTYLSFCFSLEFVPCLL